jgi:sporulation integral membrane protein YtvI
MPLRTVLFMACALIFLYLLFTAGAPFLLALVAALFLEPLNELLMRRLKMNRLAASTVSSSLFTAALIGLIVLIGMKLVGQLIAFWGNVPNYLNGANAYLQQLLDRFNESDSPIRLDSWMSNLTGALNRLAESIYGSFVGFAKGVPDLLVFFIVFLVAVYLFSFSLPTMKTSFLSVFEERSRLQVEAVLQNLRKSVFGFLRAQILISVLTYMITFFGLLIIGTGYPLAIALLIVIVDILPILGTGTVLIPWAVYQFAAGDAFTGAGLILLYLVITVVRRIVEPKIIGDAVGIGALSALISLYVGYELVGLIGVFLGPIVVIVYMAARKAGLLDFKIKL